MKRSNILLIAFFSLVFVSILYLYITAKNNEKQNSSNIVKSEYTLPPFSVVVAESGSQVSIQLSDSSSLVTRFVGVEKDSKKPFIVRNDTLFILANKTNQSIIKQPDIYYGKGVFIDLYCKSVNAVVGKANSRVNIQHSSLDSLSVLSLGGLMSVNTDDKFPDSNTSECSYIVSACKGGSVDFSGIKMSSLMIELDSAKMIVTKSDIIDLQAALKNKSDLKLIYLDTAPNNINVSKQDSSTFKIY